MNRHLIFSTAAVFTYIAGMIINILLGAENPFSYGYILGEILQIASITLMICWINVIDNISMGSFLVKYCLILAGFLLIYKFVYGMNEDVYVILFIYKFVLTTIAGYTICIKWSLAWRIKLASMVIVMSACLYLAFFDFITYGNRDYQFMTVVVCVGMLLAYCIAQMFSKIRSIQRQAGIALNNEYLTTFAENSSDMIFYYTLRPYPRFSFISPACEEILGYKTSDFYNNNMLPVEIATEEDRPAMQSVLSGDGDDVCNATIRVESKRGEKKYLQCIVNKVYENGRAIACEGVFRDITDRIETDRQMAENNKSRNLMLSYISHDLRTPITYIMGYAEALQKNVITNTEERDAAIESIHRNGNTLLKLVNDISLLSKLESGRFSYRFETIRCYEFFDEMRELCLHNYDNAQAKTGDGRRFFVYVLDQESVFPDDRVIADIDKCRQVIENLVSNAMKATEPDGHIAVRMTASRIERMMHLQITDDGMGIGEEELPYIFDNFYRSPQMKNRRNGSGLGLSLALQIATGHGGDISVNSVIGSGSTFSVNIPLYGES